MKSNWFMIALFATIVIVIMYNLFAVSRKNVEKKEASSHYPSKETAVTLWRGANHSTIPYHSDNGPLIGYGYELIAHTSKYLGPKGIVAHISKGMNCQNCHLNGGTVPWGNNFGKVCATYPLFMPRSNSVESVYDRVNDCFERSLNGVDLDSNSHEMNAIYAYIKWLDKDVPKSDTPDGTTIMRLKYMYVAADPVKGKGVYMANCKSCHGDDGQGKVNADGNEYTYPPLWGEHSYNDGAGLYRISSFASFVKNNMPFGTDYRNPKLFDEDAWNVAAFVNNQPRPHRDQTADWKNVENKPIDFPFGPYNDTFSETQHKFGPFTPIKNAQKQKPVSKKLF